MYILYKYIFIYIHVYMKHIYVSSHPKFPIILNTCFEYLA